MPVTLYDLCGNCGGMQPEFPAYMCLNGRRKVRVCPDSARKLANRNNITRRFKHGKAASELIVHEGHFQSECDRLGVNAMSSTYHRSEFVAARFGSDRSPKLANVHYQQVGRLTHLDRQSRVKHIRTGQPAVNMPRGWANILGHIA
jgi:hypothetical protein